jgi:hypothetical protein
MGRVFVRPGPSARVRAKNAVSSGRGGRFVEVGRAVCPIDDDVDDRKAEARSRAVYDAPLEPVRTLFRVCRDHQLVRCKQVEGIVDRLQRICVSDNSVRLHTGKLEAVEAVVEPCLGLPAGHVLVRDPVAQTRVERGRNHEDVSAVVAAVLDGGVQYPPLDRLVGDYEDPAIRWLLAVVHVVSPFVGRVGAEKPGDGKSDMKRRYESHKDLNG